MSTLIKEIPKHGKAKYIQGDFYSEKNESKFPYKSSYELAYLHQIESNTDILKYIYEPFELYYNDFNKKQRIYRPDFMVLYSDGSIEIVEIKPKIMLEDFDVKAKANSCRKYLEENYKGVNIVYKFITEDDLFRSEKEYIDFIRTIKG